MDQNWVGIDMIHVTTSFTYFTGSKVGPPRIKIMQKIVLFIEPAWRACDTPSKIGNLFMNRFAIDEDAKNEILKIYQLENQLFDLCYGRLTHEEGPGLINYRIACDL